MFTFSINFTQFCNILTVFAARTRHTRCVMMYRRWRTKQYAPYHGRHFKCCVYFTCRYCNNTTLLSTNRRCGTKPRPCAQVGRQGTISFWTWYSADTRTHARFFFSLSASLFILHSPLIAIAPAQSLMYEYTLIMYVAYTSVPWRTTKVFSPCKTYAC